MRGRIIGKIEVRRKITDVAREFDIAHSVVSRLWKSFKTTGMCSRRHGGGRVRSTTPAEDRYIVLSAKRNRRTTAQQVANQFLAASGKQISRKTVARRLRGGGLYARRPVVCVPLTRQHRTARLQWCREHHNWTEQDWACSSGHDRELVAGCIQLGFRNHRVSPILGATDHGSLVLMVAGSRTTCQEFDTSTSEDSPSREANAR
ncbi:hypothetical protein TNCV_3808471 [Trichonephila clavipes]|nr:hypothetical protein TNCV_3808471 [Trichonephila clavipes]